MRVLKHFFLLALLTVTVSTTAQIKIPNTHFSFSFPSNGWKYLQTNKVDNDVTVYLYSYAKDYVIDSVGDTVIPFMRIYVRQNFDGTVYDLALNRYTNQPFEPLDNYVLKDGSLGYLGAYTSTEDSKDYVFRMLYMKDGKTAIEIRLECPLDNYEDFEGEFLSILHTIKKD